MLILYLCNRSINYTYTVLQATHRAPFRKRQLAIHVDQGSANRGPRAKNGPRPFKMAREKLTVNGKLVHLAREAKIWPATPAEAIFGPRGKFFWPAAKSV